MNKTKLHTASLLSLSSSQLNFCDDLKLCKVNYYWSFGHTNNPVSNFIEHKGQLLGTINLSITTNSSYRLKIPTQNGKRLVACSTNSSAILEIGQFHTWQ